MGGQARPVGRIDRCATNRRDLQRRQTGAEDQPLGRRVAETLLPKTMDELRRLITDTSFLSAGPQHSSCQDCFIYDFELSSEARTTPIHMDDTSIGDSGAEALILFLRSLRDAALKARR